jgi:thymidylate synthase (FAD)
MKNTVKRVTASDFLFDSFLNVQVLSASPFPQRSCYAALHRCYYGDPLIEDMAKKDASWSDARFGQVLIKRALKHGHFSVLEFAHITFSIEGFSHTTIQQLTRHRLLSPMVQSFRYTVPSPEKPIEALCQFRPLGLYLDRHGNSYEYTNETRLRDKKHAEACFSLYREDLAAGRPPEDARCSLPMGIVRQNLLLSGNLRAFLNVLSQRGAKDAQLEIQALALSLLPLLKKWAPEILDWYLHKYKKRLAP